MLSNATWSWRAGSPQRRGRFSRAGARAALALLGLLWTLGGCGHATSRTSPQSQARKAEFQRENPAVRGDLPTRRQSAAFRRAVERRIPDSWIVVGVRREMEQIDGVSEPRIEVTSNDGIVTLVGTTSTPLARSLLLERVLGVAGVRAIVNRVDIAAEDASDEAIQQQVEQRLRYFPITEHKDIRATVRDGVVRLDGSLRTLAERRLAERSAQEVRGVRGIDNYIVLTKVEPRRDARIAEEIVRRVTTERSAPGAQVSVRVSSAAVFLSGTVPSESERRKLRELAFIPGVRAVHDDEVAVVRGRAHLRALDAPRPTDAEVTRAVLDTVPLDPRLLGSAIGITTRNGTVFLEGRVKDESARRAAERNAAATRGVSDVRNRIVVDPGEDVSDAEIRKEVSSRLESHPGITPRGIQVFVDNGWVLLRGQADSQFERSSAEGASGNVRGVLGVINQLDVAPRFEIAPRDDQTIRGDIVRRLEDDPRVTPGLVEIDVRDGVATVRGRLPSYAIYDAVLENVYESSPRSVDNRLEVDERPQVNDLR